MEAQENAPAATYDLPEASNKEKLAQEALLKEYELKRKAKTIVVPTDDGRVRDMLRQMGEPITLFGEREVWGMTPSHGPMQALLLCAFGEGLAS